MATHEGVLPAIPEALLLIMEKDLLGFVHKFPTEHSCQSLLGHPRLMTRNEHDLRRYCRASSRRCANASSTAKSRRASRDQLACSPAGLEIARAVESEELWTISDLIKIIVSSKFVLSYWRYGQFVLCIRLTRNAAE